MTRIDRIDGLMRVNIYNIRLTENSGLHHVYKDYCFKFVLFLTQKVRIIVLNINNISCFLLTIVNNPFNMFFSY